MTPMDKFFSAREKLFVLIRKALEEDGHCKSYEGVLRIIFPNYFESTYGEKGAYKIELGCYVVGPTRHYDWSGDTLEEVVSKFSATVDLWETDQTKTVGADFAGIRTVEFTLKTKEWK